jgi:hypothetical protein
MSTEEKIKELEKELAFYKHKFSLSENDVAVQGYLAYVNIVRQMVDYVKDFSIKANIDGKKSENAMYERTEKIWGELPDMISSMNRLKMELKIEFDPEEGKPKMTVTNPQAIAKLAKP